MEVSEYAKIGGRDGEGWKTYLLRGMLISRRRESGIQLNVNKRENRKIREGSLLGVFI